VSLHSWWVQHLSPLKEWKAPEVVLGGLDRRSSLGDAGGVVFSGAKTVH
jgi:hypothetical protein